MKNFRKLTQLERILIYFILGQYVGIVVGLWLVKVAFK